MGKRSVPAGLRFLKELTRTRKPPEKIASAENKVHGNVGKPVINITSLLSIIKLLDVFLFIRRLHSIVI